MPVVQVQQRHTVARSALLRCVLLETLGQLTPIVAPARQADVLVSCAHRGFVEYRSKFLAGCVSLVLFSANPALAQRADDLRLASPAVKSAIGEAPDADAVGREQNAAMTINSARSIAKSAGVGALIGAAAGTVMAVYQHSKKSGDTGYPAGVPRPKSDPYVAFVVFIPTGAAIGAVVGAIVGATR